MAEQDPGNRANGMPLELAAVLEEPAGTGRDRAWAVFVERYSRILLHVAHSHAEGYDDAMDRYTFVLEELQKKDFARLRRFAGDGRSRLSTWLVVVARRLCDDFHRSRYGRLRVGNGAQGRKARERHDLRRRLIDMAASEFNIDLVPDGSELDPEAALRGRELERALREALEALAVRDRLMIKLRYYEGMSAKEIADLMGLRSQFRVHRKLKAALAEVRSMLESSGVGDARP